MRKTKNKFRYRGQFRALYILPSKNSKEVFAFEPNPYPLRYLYSLVENNTSVLPIAIGNVDQNIELNIPKKEGLSSNGASLKNIDIASGIKLNVTCKKNRYPVF